MDSSNTDVNADEYVVSDLHLNHANIIEYCDRPFESTAEMNDVIVEDWNEAIEPDDRVFFLGDLAMARSAAEVEEWLEKLNGRITFVRGNHDRAIPVETHTHVTLERDGHTFYLTHFPENVPDDWNGWAIYGHHHNNYPDEYPFVDPHARRINVSIELLGYKPVAISELLTYVDAEVRYIVRPGVPEAIALQQ